MNARVVLVCLLVAAMLSQAFGWHQGSSSSEDVNRCTLPKEVGSCYKALPRFYFNTRSGNCEQFIYGGCGGNDNNFDSFKDCYAECGSAGFLECGDHCYQRLNAAVNYTEAEAQCEAIGAHLAVPLTEEDNQCAIALANGRNSWLGLNDRETEGEYVRADGNGALSEAVIGSFWAPEEPGAGKQNRDCLMLKFVEGNPKGWKDLGCHQERRPLCQLRE